MFPVKLPQTQAVKPSLFLGKLTCTKAKKWLTVSGLYFMSAVPLVK